jgi:hypothetical protein
MFNIDRTQLAQNTNYERHQFQVVLRDYFHRKNTVRCLTRATASSINAGLISCCSSADRLTSSSISFDHVVNTVDLFCSSVLLIFRFLFFSAFFFLFLFQSSISLQNSFVLQVKTTTI